MAKQRCPHDGGTCHHACAAACFRKATCEPLTLPWPGFPVSGDAPVHGDTEDQAALTAAVITVAGGAPVARLSGDPPQIEVVDHAAPSVISLWRAAAQAITMGIDCDDAEADLAALQEGKLSPEGRLRLRRHLTVCTRCLDLARALAEALEAERRQAVIDAGRKPGGGVGGSA